MGDDMRKWKVPAGIALFLLATSAGAEERANEVKASFIFNGERVLIGGGNPDAARFAMRFATARPDCAGPCIAPLQVAEGVQSLDELQVLEFLTTKVAGNIGLMVDARRPEERAVGFIPGSVNLPHSTVAEGNSYRDDILRALGAREFDGLFNFTDARQLLVYDNGPASNDAGLLVANLLAAGYPAELIRYYRGGMQVWAVLGLSIQEGQS